MKILGVRGQLVPRGAYGGPRHVHEPLGVRRLRSLSYPTHTTHTTTATEPAPVVAAVDVVIVVPASWTAEQRALWEEQMDYHPGWTPAEVAAFEAHDGDPSDKLDGGAKGLYAAHLSHIPSSWSTAQQATLRRWVDSMRTPWMGVTQTAAVEDTTTTTSTTYATAPSSGSVVQPSNPRIPSTMHAELR